MVQTITIGNGTGCPGQIVYGTFKGVELPTGGSDDIPIIITQGSEMILPFEDS